MMSRSAVAALVALVIPGFILSQTTSSNQDKQGTRQVPKVVSTRLVIHANSECKVSVDGQEVKQFTAPGTISVRVQPGEHAIDAVGADPAQVFSQVVQIDKGTSKLVKVELSAAPAATAKKSDALAKQLEQAQQQEDSRRRQAAADAAARLQQEKEEAAKRAAELDGLRAELREALEELNLDKETLSNLEQQAEQHEQQRQQQAIYNNGGALGGLAAGLGGVSKSMEERQIRNQKQKVREDQEKIKQLKSQIQSYSDH